MSSNNDGPELSFDINRGNDDFGATSMDETNNTHLEGTVHDETDFINDFYENSKFNYETEDLPVHTFRRSSRQTKLPSSLNDFIVEGKVKYDVERVVNYANLNHDNYCFISSLNKSVEPTCYEEAILDNLPPNRKAIRNKWIYKIKYKSSGDINRYKARLVVKGFNKKEGIDFDNTFSLVVKMSTVRCVIALSVTNNWPLFQLDVNNEFLYGDLDEDIYMTIPKGFASKDNKNKFIALLVYVDDIVITGNCMDEIDKFKIFLKSKFKIKDLGHLKYFLGIEVIKTGKDLCISQRKYCLELLKDYGLLGCKPISAPVEPNSVLPYVPTKDDPLLDNITGYQKLLGKLIYLTHTRPDIAYSVYCLAQYMHSPLKSHLNYALNVLRYLKGAPGKEAEYKSLSSAACEIIWIQKLLLDLNTKVTLPIDLHYDNKFALQLAINLVFHERPLDHVGEVETVYGSLKVTLLSGDGTDIKEMDIIKAKTDKAEHEKERVHKSRELSSYGQQKLFGIAYRGSLNLTLEVSMLAQGCRRDGYPEKYWRKLRDHVSDIHRVGRIVLLKALKLQEKLQQDIHEGDHTVLLRPLRLLENKGKLAIFKGTSARSWKLCNPIFTLTLTRSFEEIKTRNDRICNTFKDACLTYGLINDDKEWTQAILEASLWVL
ncbi:ribonuclease H-like domain-containing protein [Tanacetum coccineum]